MTNTAAVAVSTTKPTVLWGRHRFHELARWMLATMPAENHHQYLLQSSYLPGDERDRFRKMRVLNERWMKNFEQYLYINRFVLRCRKWAQDHPATAPVEPFIHWWQCGIEAVGTQFFTIDKSVASGNFWNASNIWELCPKESQSINAHALFLETPEQRYLLCFMLALYSPFRARELCLQLDVDLDETQHLQQATRRLIFNLLVTFTSF